MILLIRAGYRFSHEDGVHKGSLVLIALLLASSEPTRGAEVAAPADVALSEVLVTAERRELIGTTCASARPVGLRAGDGSVDPVVPQCGGNPR
jgi:hypothetical protein